MPILLSHNSSLERLRSVPPQVDSSTIIYEPLDLAAFARTGRLPSEADLRALGLLQRPVHCLVPSSKHAGIKVLSRTHRCPLPAIPPRLVKQVTDDVYSCGPELTFVQMANKTSLLGTVVLGYELCGSYAHFSQMISGFYERPPLTSVEKMRSAIDAIPGVHGRTAAREALRYVRDKSASPMETVVSCMLSLPTSMGGYGMVLPELNYAVELDEAEATLAGTNKPRIDTAYVEDLIGVEFDGKDYHRDLEHDLKRRTALTHRGWTIYVLNVDELTFFSKFKEKVALLDKIPRRSGETKPTDENAKDLLGRLRVATRFGVGPNAVLFGTSVPQGLIKVHL